MSNLTPEHQKSLLEDNGDWGRYKEITKMAQEGLKVLSFAYKDMKMTELEELL